jgi:lipid-binding SYLF domain-containing protein
MKSIAYLALMLAFTGFGLVGCSTTPPTEEKRDALHDDVRSTLAAMRNDSPDFASFLDKAYAYAVYPNVGEGAFIVGGGGGRGQVYENGRMIGYSTVKKATVGLQAGGQKYAEVIVFEDAGALHRFIDHEFRFAANATAVAIKSGVAANAKFQNGTAIFQYTKGGLEAGVSVGGQSFAFSPANP